MLALELILRQHDTHREKGVIFGGECVHTLGYADDAALLDGSREVATARVTAIAQGSRSDADMTITVILKLVYCKIHVYSEIPCKIRGIFDFSLLQLYFPLVK